MISNRSIRKAGTIPERLHQWRSGALRAPGRGLDFCEAVVGRGSREVQQPTPSNDDATQMRITKLSSALLLSMTLGVAALAQNRHTLDEICGDCRVEKFATCGGFLEGATFDRNGVLWVVDLLSGNIVRVDERAQCHVEGTTGGAPNGAKFHRDGRLFIADKNLGLVAFDPTTKDL